MKKINFSIKKILKTAFVAFSCCLIFSIFSYSYLNANLQNDTAEADQKNYNVPYERTPQSKGIAFIFPDNSAVIVYLDFKSQCISLYNVNKFNKNQKEYNGYTADYTVEANYDLIEGIIDRVGGVDITTNGEKYRYTGIQVVEMLSNGESPQIKNQIVLNIFKQISRKGFAKDDFVFIVENTKTDISIIDCLYWLDYLKDMSLRAEFVN